MNLLTRFLKSLSPQAQQARYNRTYRAVTGTQAPPKAWNAPAYELHSWNIIKHPQNETATVSLRGKRGGKWHIEHVPLSVLPGETDQELIRCAAWISPSKWHIPMPVNISQFGGRFDAPLDDRLFATLPEQSAISVSSDI